MSYWAWDPSLSTGIDIMDEQHRKIVDYINELEEARLDDDREKVSIVLKGLVDYTLTHFAFEEEYMEKSGYPLSDAHKKVHMSFAVQIENYVIQHDAGKDITRKLLSDLKVWLTNHIKYQDKDYAVFLQQPVDDGKGWVGRVMNNLLAKLR